tara:strand:- start:125 stop:340 length:216 start_codon:yes stop_codon:yes gene_type:complete
MNGGRINPLTGVEADVNKKTKKKIEVIKKKLETLRRQLAGAKKQTDEVGEVERLSADVAQAESSLAELKNS